MDCHLCKGIARYKFKTSVVDLETGELLVESGADMCHECAVQMGLSATAKMTKLGGKEPEQPN